MFRKLTTVIAVYVTSLIIMALQKPLFLIWYAERSAEATAAELWGVSWHGLLLDSTTAGYLSVIPWLLMLITVWIAIPERVMRKVLNTYYLIVSLIVALGVAADIALFRHWGFRLDSTVLLYLKTPEEAAASITWNDLWPALLLLIGYSALMFFALRPTSKIYRAERPSPIRRFSAMLTMLLLGGFLFLAIRGGTGTAPANVSKVYFSDNMFLNQAATNPIFSFISSATRSELKEGDYRYFSDEQCEMTFSAIKGNSDITATTSHLTTQRPNVVLIILESLGRTVTDEIIDGREVTPNINRLRREGIWFENIYANSYRTDRGTVAIMSGYPTHPKASIMKYPQKAHTLPSIARALQQEGYATSFTYGGDANFTNTISYLYGTGIEQVIDERSLSFNVERDTKWGYDDDLVCQYFADKVLALAGGIEPFFATLLTLSSHEPFEVPHNAFGNKILNAAAFTDHHVGLMIDKWRANKEWENMLVILIADHGMPYPETVTIGDEIRQRIPMIWCGGVIDQSLEVDTFASQADLATTLLHQMGIPTDDFAFSKDIFDSTLPHFGFYTYNNGFGIASPEGFVRHDCTRDALVESRGEEQTIEEFTTYGKTLVQTLHKDIIKR